MIVARRRHCRCGGPERFELLDATPLPCDVVLRFTTTGDSSGEQSSAINWSAVGGRQSPTRWLQRRVPLSSAHDLTPSADG